MKRKSSVPVKKQTPLYGLKAFNPKEASFYIQDFKKHWKEHSFVEKPHQHDFYLILFIRSGKGTHTIDFTEYPVRANTLFLMTPGQVHTWKLSPETEGTIIFFTREFYQLHLNESSLLDFPFYHSLDASPAIALAKNKAITFAIEQMLESYTPNPNLRLLRAYLDVLLLETASHYDTLTVKTHSNTFKLRKLEKLIEENFKTIKQPSEYAERMNLAPTYLNSICKNNLGKTLSELIQARVLLEAKRLFAYADLTVNEVAVHLNFTDTSYFIRWFKKSSGLTPDQFRQAQQTGL